jgi:hypothetical protein
MALDFYHSLTTTGHVALRFFTWLNYHAAIKVNNYIDAEVN